LPPRAYFLGLLIRFSSSREKLAKQPRTSLRRMGGFRRSRRVNT